ncbi:antitoxin VapB family protein [Halorussus amylolyticus]|uniref:antitoxin VapB family protein n=1 Tax=Halorussus amylolyticus TaxID=1126242 RepID=UPI0010502DBA|nr:antitoxin VapB family protein [Halorussus amylolyticus]
MGTANKQIRISETVKREIERRRREGESYNDVLERVFEDDDRDLLAGFGRWDDDHAERVRRKREATKQKSKDRMADLGEE